MKMSGGVSDGEKELVDVIRQANPEFASVEDQHVELDRKIQSMETRAYLTAEEEIEVRHLKKMKLKAKDEMAQILRKHQEPLSDKTG